MAYVRRLAVAVTATVSGGAAQTWVTGRVSGYLEAVRIVNGATGLSTAAHLTITGQQSGISILNVTSTGATGGGVTYFPRGRAVDSSNVTLGEGAGASAPLPTYIPLDENISIVGTSMGTVSGNGGRQATFHFYISGAAAG